jgi:uncharacterized protein (DUF2062 family)
MDRAFNEMNRKRRLVTIASVSGGVAGGVSAGVGSALQLHPLYYVVIALIIGVSMPIVLSLIWQERP